MRRTGWGPLTAVVCLALVATACSTDPVATPSPTPAPTATPTAAEPTSTPTPLPTATPLPPAGVLRVAVTGAAPHRDLHRMVSEWATLFGPGLAYSRLMRFVAGPGTPLPGLIVECDLCDEWRLVDPTTYEFDVHRDARWQETDDFASRPVTPQDVVFSLERLREPGSPHVALLDSVDTIALVGERTVRLSLRFPDPELLVKLASPYAVVMASDSFDGVDVATGRVLGSGPWRFDQSATGQVTVTARDGYFRGGEPALERIEFIPATSVEIGATALRLGSVDMAQVTEEQWRQIEGGGFQSVVLERQGRGVVFGINARESPFDEERVRGAMFAALDPYAALEGSFGVGGVGTGTPVLEPSWLLDDASFQEVFGRPEHARDTLREADQRGLAVTLTVANFGESYVAHGELLAAQLRSVGLAVSVDVVSRGVYLDQVWQRRDFDAFVGPLPPVDTTNAFLLGLLHSRGSSNVTGADDADLDVLIEGQAVELDAVRRAELVREIQAIALERAWMFMPVVSTERWVFSSRVIDPPRAFPVGSGDWWKTVRLAPSEP